MRKIFSSIFFIVLLPARTLKRIGKDSFVMGLIFGAIFSLIVNIVTVQIQEVIQKQRILEAVENEILSNILTADSTISSFNRTLENKESPNYFHIYRLYSRDLWEQSSEPLQYIAQLDPKIQGEILVYYITTIPSHNQMILKLNNLADSKLKDCFFPENKLSANQESYCQSSYYAILKNEVDSAEDISTRGLKLLKTFHPTQDRLNSVFLRTLIGNNSMRILSGH